MADRGAVRWVSGERIRGWKVTGGSSGCARGYHFGKEVLRKRTPPLLIQGINTVSLHAGGQKMRGRRRYLETVHVQMQAPFGLYF